MLFPCIIWSCLFWSLRKVFTSMAWNYAEKKKKLLFSFPRLMNWTRIHRVYTGLAHIVSLNCQHLLSTQSVYFRYKMSWLVLLSSFSFHWIEDTWKLIWKHCVFIFYILPICIWINAVLPLPPPTILQLLLRQKILLFESFQLGFTINFVVKHFSLSFSSCLSRT